MEVTTSGTWRVTFDGAAALPHAALAIRDADPTIRIPDRSLPPALVWTPPFGVRPLPLRVWAQWWDQILDHAGDRLPSSELPWAPDEISEVVGGIGPQALRWASNWIKARNPFVGDRFVLINAIRNIQRTSGGRLPPVRMLGLAVTGHWMQVDPNRHMVLASWDACSEPEPWIEDALRAAVG